MAWLLAERGRPSQALDKPVWSLHENLGFHGMSESESSRPTAQDFFSFLFSFKRIVHAKTERSREHEIIAVALSVPQLNSLRSLRI